jgi:transposase
MKYRTYERLEQDMIGHRLEEYVEGNVLVDFIDEFIDGLDLREFYDNRVQPGNTAYDPRLGLKVFLYGYARKITSSRKLAEACRENVGFMYLVRNNFPQYRWLAYFRVQNKELLIHVFVQLLGYLQEKGITRFGHVVIDKTTMTANASPATVLSEYRMEQLEGDVRQWLEETATQDEQEEREEIPENVQEEFRQKLGRVSKVPEAIIQAVRMKVREQLTNVSVTDPDARFMKESGKKRSVLGYGVQTAVTPEGFIAGVQVVQTGTDHHQLSPMIKHVEHTTGKKVEAADADSGYFVASEVKALEAQGYDTCVPDTKYRQSLKSPTEDVLPTHCSYDAQHDSYRCPGGKDFQRAQPRKKRHPKKLRYVKHYYRRTNDCGDCSRRATCAIGNKDSPFVGFTISEEHAFILENRQKLNQPSYQHRLKHRGAIVERPYGHMKHNLGFRRFNLRGLIKVGIEALILVTSTNLTRLVHFLNQ